MKGYVPLIVSFILTVCTTQAATIDDDEIINPSWVKPDAWSKHERQQRLELAEKLVECNCPPIEKCEPIKPCPIQPESAINPVDENNRLAAVFYKKFVTRLFAENQLINDEQSGYLLRNVQFKVTPQQIKELNQAGTAHEIDGLISSIMQQSKNSIYEAIAENVSGFRTMYTSILDSGYFLFLFVPTVGMLVAFFVVKVFSRVMHVHPLVVVFLMFIGISFVISYKECNLKLEMESLTKLMRHDGTNPCQQKQSSGGGLLAWAQKLFGEDSEAKCLEHLRETMGASTRTCDPSEVFVEMVAKLHLKYLETFVYKLIGIFKGASATAGIVETLLIGGFMLLLVYILVTYGLKYGIYGFSSFLSNYVTSFGTTPALAQAGQPSYAALPVDQQQLLATPISQPPSFNFHINIGRKSTKVSRLENNRVEEITMGNEQPVAALKMSSVSPGKNANGSGDAQKQEPGSEYASELESGDETVEFECIIPTVGGHHPEGLGSEAAANRERQAGNQ